MEELISIAKDPSAKPFENPTAKLAFESYRSTNMKPINYPMLKKGSYISLIDDSKQDIPFL